jgi:hypothetical protein
VSSGHLFVVNGDLTKIACDALLIPTDGIVNSTASWRAFLADKTYPTFFEFGSRVMRALPASSKEPDIWLGNLGQYGDVNRTGSAGGSNYWISTRGRSVRSSS